jgi:hypothetical protein
MRIYAYTTTIIPGQEIMDRKFLPWPTTVFSTTIPGFGNL